MLIFKIFWPLRPNRDTKLSLNPQRDPFNVKMLPHAPETSFKISVFYHIFTILTVSEVCNISNKYWLPKFFFQQFSLNCMQLQNMNENFQLTIISEFQKKKNFTRFSIKIFFSEIHFTSQRSNLYEKCCEWLIWGEHERRNEYKFKNMRTKRKYRHWQKKIRATR